MKKMKRLLLALLSVTCIGVAAAGFAGCVGGSSSRQSSIGGGQGNTGNSGDVGTTESYCYISTDSYTDEYGVAGTYTEYNDKKFVVGTEVSLEATVNDGYNFEGWFVDGTCMSTDLVYEFEAKNDLWVVAEYSYYTVSTWGDGDDYETAGTYTKMEDQKVSAGEQVVLTATVNDGYNFEGWYIGAWSDVCVSTDLTYTFTMEKENKEIYAKYSYYVVNTWGDGDDYETAGTYTKMEDQKVSAGTKVTLTATVNDGYNFEGWYIGWSDVCVSTDLTYTFTMEKENKEIYAKYSYYVVNTWGDGDDYGMAGTYTQMEDEKVSAGTQVTLTATVKSGYRFLGWYRDDVCMTKNLKYTFAMKKEDIGLRAVFEKIE